MDYMIREMKPSEYPLLDDFLYNAIFQREGDKLAPKTIIKEPALQIYISDFGKKKDDYCIAAEAEGKLVGAVWTRVINGYKKASLAVQKDNYAFKIYQKIGFVIVGETEQEYIMAKELDHVKD